MKYKLISFIFILINLSVFSQKKGIVYYGQIESIGLKSPLGPDFNAYLIFNNNESYYVSAKDSLDSKTTFKSVYDNADGSHGISRSVYTTPYGNQVYNNKLKDSLYWNQWVNFYVAEKRPIINWKLEKETKKIANFTVHKATGKFRGRMYTAWYTLEIPLPFGPWKLQGLPGLILEAYDNDKEIYFYFKSLEYPTTKNIAVTQVKRPNDHTKTWKTLQDFKDRLDFFYEKRRNTAITIAQKYGTEVPEEKIKSELFLESF